MKVNIICDLDGTLAIDEERAKRFLHQPCPKMCSHGECDTCHGKGVIHHWEEYFQACHEDTPNSAVLNLLQCMEVEDYLITLLTGRSDIVREKTLQWLRRHNVPYDQLIMRPKDDRTDDHVLKIVYARNLGLTPENTLFVLEDRQRVVDAWRAAGYQCFQVAPGNF